MVWKGLSDSVLDRVKVIAVLKGLSTLALMKACSWSNSLVFCSTTPRYWSMVVSVTPECPPRREVMADESHPVLVNTESTPDGGEVGERTYRVGVSFYKLLGICSKFNKYSVL